MAKREITGKRAASAASKVLRNKGSNKSTKSAAGSALSQTKAPNRVTSSKAGSAASKTLRNSKSNKSSKSAAGSALTQRPNRRK